ncbi:hypothetical protein Pla175_17140 [Pirellulimonas nuda]|uniref:Uncharacterized protein n=1 Tax=Pirellulimonas nuda TaxID=2528009 RepID=A0A518DA30_9BACT|nr:hypothetical protein [Pirellulimonas nuda]QDU88339.1 hypothetical protein Pla175_17140 [Pirellulimonas nuda]
MKSILRNLTRAMWCVAAGAAAYYAQDAWRAKHSSRSATHGGAVPVLTTIDTITGDQLLAAAQLAVDQPTTLVADIEQTGLVAEQSVSLSGQYQQQGRGESRRFCWTLRGRVGRGSVRLWQVSAQDILWTDLAWDTDGPNARRSVERIDLARLRAEVAPSGDLENIDPGQARAAFARPELWPTQGGLPALLVALGQTFKFNAPALMRMRDRPVYALIGRSSLPADGAYSVVPDHVLLVVDATLRMPILVEYRASDDPLADSALADSQRLIESERPLFRIRILNPRPDAPVDADRFAYTPPPDVAWTDRTDARLRNLRQAVRPRAEATTRPPADSVSR